VGAGSSPARVSHLPAVAICLILVAGLVVVLVEWRSQRVASLRSAAARLLRSGESLQREKAIGYLEAATRIRPNDSRPWAELMFAELAAAAERGPTLGATVAGPAAFTVVPELPAGDPGGHVSAALRAARSGRLCQPLNPAFHLVLGTFADRFTRTEPAAVHFDRAKTVAGYDPEVWYAAGRAAALRGDWDAALADWHESLVRSPRRLDVIVRRAAKRLPPAGLRSRLLPDDPAVWLDATPLLFPREDDPARRDWLRATADRWASGPEPRDAAGLLDWAETLRELGDLPAAISACRRAVDHFPEETPPHDRLAQLLEADEQYEAALPLLEWLVDREPKRTEYRDRLDAAHHALKLKAEINGP
jgi:tetratricopeptide (TPR) repeat protein